MFGCCTKPDAVADEAEEVVVQARAVHAFAPRASNEDVQVPAWLQAVLPPEEEAVDSNALAGSSQISGIADLSLVVSMPMAGSAKLSGGGSGVSVKARFTSASVGLMATANAPGPIEDEDEDDGVFDELKSKWSAAKQTDIAKWLARILKVSQETTEKILFIAQKKHAFKALSCFEKAFEKLSSDIRMGFAFLLKGFGHAWMFMPSETREGMVKTLAKFISTCRRMAGFAPLLPRLDKLDAMGSALLMFAGLIALNTGWMKTGAKTFLGALAMAKNATDAVIVTGLALKFLAGLLPPKIKTWFLAKVVGRKVPVVGTVIVGLFDVINIIDCPGDWKSYAGLASTVAGAIPGYGTTASFLADICICVGIVIEECNQIELDMPGSIEEIEKGQSTHVDGNGVPIGIGSVVRLKSNPDLQGAFHDSKHRKGRPVLHFAADGELCGWSPEKDARADKLARVHALWEYDAVTLEFEDHELLDFPEECFLVTDPCIGLKLCPYWALHSGGDIMDALMTIAEAKSQMMFLPDCAGFTFQGDFTDVPKVERIEVSSGLYIDQVVFVMSGGTRNAFGTSGGAEQEPFTLGPGEYLVEVQHVSDDTYLRWISFHTSLGRSESYGSPPAAGSTPLELSALPGKQIVGLERGTGHCPPLRALVYDDEPPKRHCYFKTHLLGYMPWNFDWSSCTRQSFEPSVKVKVGGYPDNFKSRYELGMKSSYADAKSLAMQYVRMNPRHFKVEIQNQLFWSKVILFEDPTSMTEAHLAARDMVYADAFVH